MKNPVDRLINRLDIIERKKILNLEKDQKKLSKLKHIIVKEMKQSFQE